VIAEASCLFGLTQQFIDPAFPADRFLFLRNQGKKSLEKTMNRRQGGPVFFNNGSQWPITHGLHGDILRRKQQGRDI
jgi:hypothetical protein